MVFAAVVERALVLSQWPAAGRGVYPASVGASSSRAPLVVSLCYNFGIMPRAEYEGYRPKRPVIQGDRWLTLSSLSIARGAWVWLV